MRITQPVATLLSKVTPDADYAMGGYKFTGLGAGSASGHSLRYEQVVGVYLLLAGGTLTGDLTIGAHLLKTTDLALKQEDASYFSIRNAADDAFKGLNLTAIRNYGHHLFMADARGIYAPDVDATYFVLGARDSGVSNVEVARFQGAADPYFQLTLPPVLTATARPGTPVEGHIVSNSATGAFEIYDGTHWKQEVHSIHVTIDYDDVGVNDVSPIPAGALVLACLVNITTAFNGTTPTIEIGDDDDADGFGEAAATLCETPGWKDVSSPELVACGDYFKDGTYHLFKFYPAAKTAKVTVASGNGLTEGKAEIYFIYITLD